MFASEPAPQTRCSLSRLHFNLKQIDTSILLVQSVLFKMEIKVAISFLLLLLALFGATIQAASELIRAKRQAQSNARSSNQMPASPEIAPSLSGASATSMSSNKMPKMSSMNLDDDLKLGSGRVGAPQTTRPARPNMRPLTTAPANENFEEDDEGPEVGVQPPRRRRPTRPNMRPGRYHDDDEDCDDDYQDYGSLFHAAFRPVRQMGDMMGNMFEHMQSLASGDFENLPADGSYAVASARSDGSGYSRQSSIVSNNGRRRGIISETRNGRTQTRRIGDEDEE